MTDRFRLARGLALLTPALLLGGALFSQYVGGLYPCEMCHWQRWPHYAAIPLALLAFLPLGKGPQKALVLLAALLIATSGAIGAFHAGVEYGWWEGVTKCAVLNAGGGDTLAAIMATPLIRCDEVQWSLLGISLAGYNAIFSLGAAGAILRLCNAKRPA